MLPNLQNNKQTPVTEVLLKGISAYLVYVLISFIGTEFNFLWPWLFKQYSVLLATCVSGCLMLKGDDIEHVSTMITINGNYGVYFYDAYIELGVIVTGILLILSVQHSLKAKAVYLPLVLITLFILNIIEALILISLGYYQAKTAFAIVTDVYSAALYVLLFGGTMWWLYKTKSFKSLT